MFRRYCLHFPGWATTLPDNWPREFRRQAEQLTVLGSMQQHFLHRLRTSIDLSADTEQAPRMLDAMENCMPRGALFARRDENDCGRHCGYSKLCPWCHARSVQQLYRRLTEGPCSAANSAGKKLVLVRVCYRDGIYKGGSVLESSEVREIRESYRDSAMCTAESLGLDGGVIFYQFGPMREYGHRHIITKNTFTPEITVIGASTSLTESYLEEHDLFVSDLLFLPAETHQVLRYLLFGTSYKYPADRIEGLVASNDRFTRYGIPGAASLQPWFLFNETQAWSYLAATAGTRLYDTFGTWRKNGRAVVKAVTEDREGERISRGQAFRNENNERRYEAGNRRAGLMRKAETVFRKLRFEKGRDPGSTLLRTALAAAGFTISERDSRWLVKQLPLSYEGEPSPVWPLGQGAGPPNQNIDN
jgi:hypothetical protein